MDINEARQIILEQISSKMPSDLAEKFAIQEKITFLQRENNNTQLDLKERNDIIRMRRRWANWLLVAILAIIVFDFFVIACVGFGWMKFNKGYIIPFFVGESLIKTLGLAIIVVKFLFNEKFIVHKKNK